MKQTVRTAVYDESLQIEAYRLQGTQRPFPNHFHGYYVIGLVVWHQAAFLQTADISSPAGFPSFAQSWG